MTARPIELRSDTFTRPTDSMRRAMAMAEVGDDVWDEDPTVHRLQDRAAELTGKEAALFVSSGTQGNLIGVLCHTRPGDEFIAGAESHIPWNEGGGTSIVGGLQLRTISDVAGQFDPDEVRGAIRHPDEIHAQRTGCVVIENTHNRRGGAVVGPRRIGEICAVAHDSGVPVHMDGARVFNAATALGIRVHELTASVDSVTFCLSKGLGAPVGSVLCGSREYILRARQWRAVLGGGMRQAGVLAAAGLVALDENVKRLAVDHANARRLAEGIADIEGLTVDLPGVQSNIVIAEVDTSAFSPQDFCNRLRGRNVLVAPAGPTSIRAVTCYEVNRDDIESALTAMRQVRDELVPAYA